MPPRSDDLWQALVRVGEPLATEEDYEHGYAREVRQDLQRYLAFRVSGETYGLPIAEAMAMTVSRLIAKRIDETSSTASARPRRRVFSSIPVVLIFHYSHEARANA